MEAAGSSEALATFYRTIRGYNPEDGNDIILSCVLVIIDGVWIGE
jgi:hypothetical protein